MNADRNTPGGHETEDHASLDAKVLADAIPQLVWIARADGWIYWYNRRWYEYTGTTPEEMSGWGWQSVHDPALLPRVMERWQQSIATGEAFEMEFPLRSSTGEFRWFLTRIAPQRDASGAIARWYGTNTDISAMKEADALLRASQEKLQESEHRLLIALNSANMGTWDWDVATNAVVWSARCHELFGVPLGEAVTYERFLAAIHPDDRNGLEKAVQEALKHKKSYSVTMRVPGEGGVMRWVLTTGRALCDESGNGIRLSGVAEDITERHLVEERVRQTQKLESLGLLAGGVAHDFNNLLTGIMCGTSVVLDTLDESSPLHSLLGTVLAGSERAAELTRQMLAYSGKGKFLLEFVNLSVKVRKTVPLVEHFVSKKVTLVLNLSDNLPLIEADRSQIEQVVMNLLTNAGEAIGDRHGTIEIHTGVEEVSSQAISDSGVEMEAGTYVTLAVRDTGCGMTAEQQSRIFDPFFTTKATGRGLGLAAIHGIVRGHKGAIQIASRPGEGTRFRILFPVAGHAAAVAEDAGVPVGRGGAARRMPRGTVLVVDDEETVRSVAKSALQAEGYEVLLAGSGAESIDLLNKNADRVELVLLDLNMPGLSGKETLPLLRTVKPDVKIIVSSGFSEKDVIQQFEADQISGFLPKPYFGSTLVGAVEAACAAKAASAR